MTALSRRAAGVGLLAAAGLALTGCGVPDRVVGLHEAPVENTDGAPFAEETAVNITTRVLDQAAAAMNSADNDVEAKEAVLTGPALRLASVQNRFDTGEENSLAAPGTPQILAISQGREWPRSILATTLSGSEQRLHVIVADSPTADYKLWISLPMIPGASVPALPDLSAGTTFGTENDSLIATPRSVLSAYGQILDFPQEKKSSKVVTADDQFADAIQASSAAQDDALGDLGTFKRRHAVIRSDTLLIGLADGSALSFGQLTRTDTLAPTSKAKQLTLPSDLARLSGTKAVTESMELDWVVTLAMVIPVEEPASMIGAAEQLRGIEAE